jgi:hypothetical protein
LAKSAYEWLWLGEDVPLVELFFPVTQMAALVRAISIIIHSFIHNFPLSSNSISQTLLLHYTELCRRAGLVVPGPIFCTWLMFTLAQLPEFLYTLNAGFHPNVPAAILSFHNYSN